MIATRFIARSKSVPAEVHAVVGEDIGATVEGAVRRLAGPNHREIRRSATDIGDEHQSLAVARYQSRFVVERGGDWLVLELNLRNPCSVSGTQERLLRPRIAFRIIVDKEDRPTDHGPMDRRLPDGKTGRTARTQT